VILSHAPCISDCALLRLQTNKCVLILLDDMTSMLPGMPTIGFGIYCCRPSASSVRSLVAGSFLLRPADKRKVPACALTCCTNAVMHACTEPSPGQGLLAKLPLDIMKVLDGALEDIQKKRHKREPFREGYLRLCLSAFDTVAEVCGLMTGACSAPAYQVQWS
jgi:hypothetical protein